MRTPTLELTHSDATRARLRALAREIPGAWVGIKIAALLLLLEGQRPGWIAGRNFGVRLSYLDYLEGA